MTSHYSVQGIISVSDVRRKGATVLVEHSGREQEIEC